MKIAIIGGGFTGLAAAYTLSKSHSVTVFEKDNELGGLAAGFKGAGWTWRLEKTYHHWFTNDQDIIGLAHELGLKNKLIIKRPVTANYWQGGAYQFDSPLSVLRYPGLSTPAKLRTSLFVAAAKINPFWQPLENISAKKIAKSIGGDEAWKNLWEPLMVAKFGNFSDKVSAAWLWARLKKRTQNLGYIEGGFYTLAEALAEAIKKNGGTLNLGAPVNSIKQIDSSFLIGNTTFDKVLLTVPSPLILKIFPKLKFNYVPHLSAQTLILETKDPILPKVYWLSILERDFPFLAAVAHTNFMDKKYYAGHHLTYFGNYLPEGHPFLSLTKDQLLKKFLPFIKRLSPGFDYERLTINSYLFTAPFAQPVQLLRYSRLAPKMETGMPNLYLANLDSIYPWDRGTNYAVELGKRAAETIIAVD